MSCTHCIVTSNINSQISPISILDFDKNITSCHMSVIFSPSVRLLCVEENAQLGLSLTQTLGIVVLNLTRLIYLWSWMHVAFGLLSFSSAGFSPTHLIHLNELSNLKWHQYPAAAWWHIQPHPPPTVPPQDLPLLATARVKWACLI